MLNHLRQSAEHLNVSALARQFNVDRKTIRRDLHLIQRGQLDPSIDPEEDETEHCE